MRIINQAEELAVWFLDCRHHNVITGFGDWFVDSAAVRNEMIRRRLHVVHAKVRPWIVRHACIRVEPKFVAAHVKPNIKRLADWIIDIGPEGGKRGGKILFEGTPANLKQAKESLTAQYI